MRKVPWWSTSLGDLEKGLLLEAFDGKRFSQGKVTEEFENRLAAALDVPYVVVTTSGTSAIQMALLAAGVGPGDEVVVPALTWIATGNAAAILGAKVVLADCQPEDPLVTVSEVRRRITSRTKAILPVHLGGRACAIEDMKDLARASGALLIEDACKALFSRTSQGYLGTLGDMGCFSLGMVSMISIGYGGAVATRDPKFYERLKLIRNQGVPRYGEDEEYACLGGNFKQSDLLSAVGIAQLSRLDAKITHVKEVYRRYSEGLAGLKGISLIPVDVSSGKLPLCVEARVKGRRKLLADLAERGVEGLPFHLSLHRAPYLESGGEFPNAEAFSKEGFILPSGPAQSLENVDYCIEVLKDLLGEARYG